MPLGPEKAKLRAALFILCAASFIACIVSWWSYHETHPSAALQPVNTGRFGSQSGFMNRDPNQSPLSGGLDGWFSEGIARSSGNDGDSSTSADPGAGRFGRNGGYGGRGNGGTSGFGGSASKSEQIGLAVYAGLFLALSGTVYLLYKRKTRHRTSMTADLPAIPATSAMPLELGMVDSATRTDPASAKPPVPSASAAAIPPARGSIWLLLGTGLLLWLALAPWLPGYPADMNYFKNWALEAVRGLSHFYTNSSSDYPPFLIYILYLVGKAAALPGMSAFFSTLIKLPSILADVAAAYLMYRLAAKRNAWIGFLLAAFYVCNPAVLINSTFWGQVDSLFTMLIMLVVIFISEGKLNWASALLAASVLMKPQGIIFTPILLFEWVNRRNFKQAILCIFIYIGTFLLIILPFSSGRNPLWIIDLFKQTIGEYPYASVNGYNFFSLIGANFEENSAKFLLFSYSTWGMLLIALTTLYSWVIYARAKNRKFAALAALFQIAGVFTFSTSMHERYLFPAAALAVCSFAYLRDKRLMWLAACFSLTSFVNMYAVLYDATGRLGSATNTLVMDVVSLLNIAGVIWLAIIMWRVSGTKTADAASS